MHINLIVHLFALAHALVAFSLRSLDLDDSIPLTVLTLAMIITISRVYSLPVDVTVALTFVCCFAGFYLGTSGAETVLRAFDLGMTIGMNAITTFVVSEVLGWITYFIAHKRNVEKS